MELVSNPARVAWTLVSLMVVAAPALALDPENPGLQQMAAQTYASSHRVGLDEANRRLLIQDRAAGIEDRLEQLLGDQYAGVWYDHYDGGRLKIGMTRAAAARTTDVLQLIREFGLGDDAALVSVTYTEAELEAIQDRARDSIADMMRSGHASTGRKLSLNKAVVRALERLPPDEEARIAELGRTPGLVVNREPGDSLLIDPTSCSITRCDPPLRGGRSIFICTIGFIARHHVNTNDLLAFTAGHCIALNGGVSTAHDETILNDWDDIGAAYGGILGGPQGIDAGVIYINPTMFWSTIPPVAQLVVKASNNTTYDPNYKIQQDAKSIEGAMLCWTGQTTGTGCAEVSALGMDHVEPGGFVIKNMGELDACSIAGGDSGGPIYKKHRAFGLLIGKGDTTFHCFIVYQGIRGAEKALNVDILVSP